MRWSVQEWDCKSDGELVSLARKGDTAAAEALLVRYQSAVRARARKFFLVGGETEDLAQEGMIGLYSAIWSYDPASGKSFKNFAYLCVTRRIYDALRAAGRRQGEDALDPEALIAADTPEDFVLYDETRAELRGKMMKELSDFEFRVVTMYLDGMSYAQITQATGKPVKSVDNALARAKRKLQVAFKE